MSKRSFLCIATFWRITQITGELDYTPDERTVKEVKDVFKTFCLNFGNACVCGSGKMWSPADHCVIRKRVCCIYLHLTLPPCLAVEPLWLGISTCSHSSYLLAFLPLLQFSMSSINIASSLCPFTSRMVMASPCCCSPGVSSSLVGSFNSVKTSVNGPLIWLFWLRWTGTLSKHK